MPTDDAASKGLIYELLSLHDYGYSQTYILLIFLTREFLVLQVLNRLSFLFSHYFNHGNVLTGIT